MDKFTEKDYLIKLGEILKIEKEQKAVSMTFKDDVGRCYTGELETIVLDRNPEPDQRMVLLDAKDSNSVVKVFYMSQIDTITTSIITHF